MGASIFHTPKTPIKICKCQFCSITHKYHTNNSIRYLEKVSHEPGRKCGFRIEDCHLRCLYEAFSGIDYDLESLKKLEVAS